MSISFTMYPDELVSLQGLAEAYGLTFRMPYDSVVYLSGDDFVVTVAVDMDGAAIWYYDIKDDSKVTQYALGLLLFQKRPPYLLRRPMIPTIAYVCGMSCNGRSLCSQTMGL